MYLKKNKNMMFHSGPNVFGLLPNVFGSLPNSASELQCIDPSL